MRHFVGGERKWPIPFKIQQYLTDPWLSDKSNISKIRKIIKSDGRCTIRDIDKTVGIYIFCGYISFWSGFSQVKTYMSDEYFIYCQMTKTVRIQTAKQLLKMLRSSKQFAKNGIGYKINIGFTISNQ